MTTLPDHAIRAAQQRVNLIDPFDLARVQPASYDVTLGSTFLTPWAVGWEPIDPESELTEQEMREYLVHPGGRYQLEAHGFALGSTVEVITLPADMVGRVEGKSSLGRLGLAVHITAGFLDPGFSGDITLELANHRERPILLRPGMAIAQVSFEQLFEPAERPYGSGALSSKYQGQRGPRPSAYWRNPK